jgi:Zn-dependent protease with chaperone function
MKRHALLGLFVLMIAVLAFSVTAVAAVTTQATPIASSGSITVVAQDSTMATLSVATQSGMINATGVTVNSSGAMVAFAHTSMAIDARALFQRTTTNTFTAKTMISSAMQTVTAEEIQAAKTEMAGTHSIVTGAPVDSRGAPETTLTPTQSPAMQQKAFQI